MKNIGFIGMGNMARAIARGFISGKAVEAANLYAFDPLYDSMKEFTDSMGMHACKTMDEMLAAVDTVIVAVKPHIVESALLPIRDQLKGRALLSIAAGWNFDRYAAILGDDVRIQAIMPNTPCSIGEGMLLFEEKNSLTDEECKEALSMFCELGEVQIMPSHLMTAAMAISGCGPAYMAMVIEALADAGVKYGLPRHTAYLLASQTMVGTGRMQIETGKHPGVIKDEVCSPAGTTIRGVEALEENGLRKAMMAAVKVVCEK